MKRLVSPKAKERSRSPKKLSFADVARTAMSQKHNFKRIVNKVILNIRKQKLEQVQYADSRQSTLERLFQQTTDLSRICDAQAQANSNLASLTLRVQALENRHKTILAQHARVRSRLGEILTDRENLTDVEQVLAKIRSILEMDLVESQPQLFEGVDRPPFSSRCSEYKQSIQIKVLTPDITLNSLDDAEAANSYGKTKSERMALFNVRQNSLDLPVTAFARSKDQNKTELSPIQQLPIDEECYESPKHSQMPQQSIFEKAKSPKLANSPTSSPTIRVNSPSNDMYREVLLRNKLKFFENELVDHQKLIEQQHEIVLQDFVPAAFPDLRPGTQIFAEPRDKQVTAKAALQKAEQSPKAATTSFVTAGNLISCGSDRQVDIAQAGKEHGLKSIHPMPGRDKKNNKYLQRVKLFGLIQTGGPLNKKIRLGPNEDDDSSGSSHRSTSKWRKRGQHVSKRKSNTMDDSDDELPFSTDIIPSLESNQSFVDKEANSSPAHKKKPRPDSNKSKTGDSQSLFNGL